MFCLFVCFSEQLFIMYCKLKQYWGVQSAVRRAFSGGKMPTLEGVTEWYNKELKKIRKEHPHDLKEYKRVAGLLAIQYSERVEEVRETLRLNLIKNVLLKNISKDTDNQLRKNKKPSKDSQAVYIPNNLVLRKLYNGQEAKNDAGRQILLVGVERDDEEHCIFTKRISEELQIGNVITVIAPDLPYFIKTEDSFLKEWRRFLEDPYRQTKFFINPTPRLLSQICLHSNHINAVKSALSRSGSFIENIFSFMQLNPFNKKFEYNPLLSGLVTNGVEKMYFGDFPAFKEREVTANLISLEEARSLFQQYKLNLQSRRYNFSAQLLLPKEILDKKFQHIVSVAKAVSQQSSKRSLLVCPADMVELITKEWEQGTGVSLYFNSELKDYYLSVEKGYEKENTFIEYIEKLVILDLILEPIIQDYFVNFKSFPYSCMHTVGGAENVGKMFLVWGYYHKNYVKILDRVNVIAEGFEEKPMPRWEGNNQRQAL